MPRGGIFCLEGQWDRDLRKRGSVLPTLELLERIDRARFMHKDVATPEELRFFVDRWTLRQYVDYTVGFFAMHGEPSKLWLTDHHSVALDELGEQLAGRCAGKRLYFGSCSVLKVPKTTLQWFLDTTGATMVCGYSRSVDWVQSAAFETVLLDVLVNGKKQNAAELRMGSAAWAALSTYLGFRIVYADGRVWLPGGNARVPAQAVPSRGVVTPRLADRSAK